MLFRSAAGDLARAYPDETLWPARDRVVMPGFVNTHAHLARHLARGLGLREPAEWRAYDRALSAEDVKQAVSAALVEGLHHGVTTVVDFHRSGACLDLSLSEVMGAADDVGVRVATCYGASEDDTPLERRNAIDESVGFAKELARKRQGRQRGMLGVHATTLKGIETLLAEAMEAARGTGLFASPHEEPARPAEHDLDYRTSFERKKRRAGCVINRGLWRRKG